jgi:hypothetical protein
MSLFIYIYTYNFSRTFLKFPFLAAHSYYLHNILHRAKRLMIFPQMLREFGILILMFVRLEVFLMSSFEGSLFFPPDAAFHNLYILKYIYLSHYIY